MRFIVDDGGRAAAGFKGEAGDCFVRAVAIATGTSYAEVYKYVNEYSKSESRSNRSSSRLGVHGTTARGIMDALGWNWTSTMSIGSGCRVHLIPDELPVGRVIVRLSRHFAAVIDGAFHDTHDGTREGRRCVYGYWTKRRVGVAEGEPEA